MRINRSKSKPSTHGDMGRLGFIGELSQGRGEVTARSNKFKMVESGLLNQHFK